jgi:hypothetical protein
MRRLIHNLTHQHRLAGKSGVGEFLTCGGWLSSTVNVMFRPDLSEADWHEVPDIVTVRRMMAADSAEAALAVLRASQE